MTKKNHNKEYSLESLRAMTGGDDAFMQSLIETFKVEVQQLIREMEEAVKEEDVDQVNKLAHKIKPTLKQFEMEDLYNKAVKLEMYDENGRELREEVMDFVDKLRFVANEISV